ncbi:MAG: DUF2157 domain-containing protein [Actinomycetota bacterium]
MLVLLNPIVLLLVVIGVVTLIVQSRQRAARPSPPTSTSMWPPPSHGSPSHGSPSESSSDDLTSVLDRWSAVGLITEEQAAAIGRYELDRSGAELPVAAPRRRVPVVAEALGYLGGTLGSIGLVLLITRYWPDMATPARLGLALVGAVGLTIAGALVPRRDEPAFERLRGFVWFGATAAVTLAAGVLAKDVAHATYAPTIALACAAAVTGHSATLWRGLHRPAQQFTCLVGALVTVGTLAAQWLTGSPVGFVVWPAAVMVLIVGLLHIGPQPSLTIAVGAIGAVVASAIAIFDWRGAGLLLFVATASTLLTLATAEDARRTLADRVVLTIVGSLAMLQALPQTISWFGHQAGIVTGLTVWIVGAVLLALARTNRVHTPLIVQLAGGALIVIGAASCGMQSVPFATLFGLATAVALLAVGTLPDHALMSVFGSIGLLVNVPWSISHFFPGEGRAPLLIFVSGLVIVGVAVMLTRKGSQLRHDLRRPHRHLNLHH